MARGLLESAGVQAWLASDDAGGAYPFQLSGGGVQLMVVAATRPPPRSCWPALERAAVA